MPYLNNYKGTFRARAQLQYCSVLIFLLGWALFVDDDFLWLGDFADLLDYVDDKYAIMCVQHDYKPDVTMKLAGRAQSIYPRKNWSSMVLWNCGHPANQNVSLSMINSKGGAYLHRFSWIEDDSLIGEIPFHWNFLVDWHTVYPDGKKPGAIHYTEGGPWFPDYRETDYSAEWFEELKDYEKTLTRKRKLCPYELFSEKGVAPLTGYENSNERWTWDQEE